MNPVLALLGKIPFLVWPLLVALAWGGWQRHEAITAHTELTTLQAEVKEDKEARQRLAAESFRASELAGQNAGTASAIKTTRIRQELAHATPDLDKALQRPVSCPAAVGDLLIPGALGVRLNAIRTAGDGEAGAAASSPAH